MNTEEELELYKELLCMAIGEYEWCKLHISFPYNRESAIKTMEKINLYYDRYDVLEDEHDQLLKQHAEVCGALAASQLRENILMTGLAHLLGGEPIDLAEVVKDATDLTEDMDMVRALESALLVRGRRMKKGELYYGK